MVITHMSTTHTFEMEWTHRRETQKSSWLALWPEGTARAHLHRTLLKQPLAGGLVALIFFPYFLKILFILYLDRGEGREKERERNINVWLPLARPLWGTWPTTQACALTGN